MKIMFVFTGGTIGSTLMGGGVIAPDAKKSYKIIEAYAQRYPTDFDYDVTEPYTELSENNTGKHIKTLCECVKSRLCEGYDGIIVTHGTDTLQYSAAALGYALGVESLPVCVVSANKPIEDERSNALPNLHAAVRFIKEKAGKGVFVTYRNVGDKVVSVHRGTRLVGAAAFSDNISSAFDCVYGHFDESYNFVKNPTYREAPDALPPLDTARLGERSDGIRVIFPYPATVYPELDESVKYILLCTYHSGTVNTRSEYVREYFDKAKRMGVKVYAAGVADGPEYQSARAFGELGIIPIKNISPVAAYLKLWLLSLDGKESVDKLSLSLGGDMAR